MELKSRLDQELVKRGLVRSRAQARDLIRRGAVRADGAVAHKPAALVAGHIEIEVQQGCAGHVSRGAEKLAAALDTFGFDPAGRTCLDIGASTGGFTEQLLSRGAKRVYAVDIGRGQLHPRLRADPRVIGMEDVDARGLGPERIPEPVDAMVADVSFISLTKALPQALGLAAPGAWLVALIKPQFEAGPGAIGKSGIVRDPAVRERVVGSVWSWLADQPDWRVMGVIESPIAGGSGNQEFLIGAVYDA